MDIPPWFGMMQSHDGPDANEAPARIDKAIEFVRLMSVKTRAGAVANDISIEVIPGQTLTKAESLALANACDCLSRYFTGTLECSEQESLHHAVIEDYLSAGTGLAVHCINCDPANPSASCLWCKGCGKVLVTPMKEI